MSKGQQRYVGASLTPFEARKFVLGHGMYIDDIALPRLLHASFVRSPYPHARLRDIRVEAACRAPGVVAVLIGRDLASLTAPFRLAPPIPGLLPMEMTTLPVDKVRFVGDLVACVIAENRYLAEDAGELVEVDYDPLPAVVDPHTAADPGQPLIDDAVPRNTPYHGVFPHGDVEAAFARADRVVEASFSQHRQTHAPLETRGCVANWTPGDDTITLWSSTQIPHPLRTQLAARLGIPESKARVITPDVGGGFGQKIPLYREELAVAAASRLLGRPIKWIEDRRENLVSACHAREDIVSVQVAVRRDGTILGVKAHILTNLGAYAFFPANYMAQVVGMMIPGPYRFQDYTYDVTTVLTNKCPAGPYRAPMLICSWVTEGMVDAVARALALDPVEVRRRNMLYREDRQYVSATGQRYESITPRDTLERALELLDYEKFRRWQAQAQVEGRLVGLGICVYVEPNTYGSAFYRQAGIPGSGHDVAIVRIEPSGAITAQIGIVSQGQGHLTTVAQVLADEFAVPIDIVRVQAGDTAAAPYGMGTRGSRGGAVSAGAAMGAARLLKDKLVRLAAHLLEARAEDLELRDGRLQVRGSPQSGFTLRELAQKAYVTPMELPPGMEPGLEASYAYDPPPLTFSNATHVCVVEIDRETGQLLIPRYIIVEDCGTMLNPRVVEGQIHGATAMGLAGAIYEEVVYDPQGQILTGTFLDYTLPTSCEVPAFEIHHLETPAPNTPLGMRGMAEGGVMGAAGAVSNAVADALAPLGIAVDRQPFSPRHVLGYLREAGVVKAS